MAAPAGDKVLYENLKKHIGYLASDALEGRRTGTKGETKATDYIAAQYKKYGLQPFGDKGSYNQEFDINEGKEIKTGTFLQYGNTVLKAGVDYFPFAFSANGKFAALVKNVGNDEKSDILLTDLKNVIDSNKNNPHFDLLQHIRQVVTKAGANGSAACIFINSSAINDSLEFSPKDKADMATMPVIYITSSGIKKLDELVGPGFGEKIISGNVELGEKSRKGHNVVAFLDNGATSTIILGGHLDHLGYGEDHNSRNTGAPAIHNGADDNASGTSAVVELARILKTKSLAGNDKNNNYLFINFSGEELGLFGSKYFTEHPVIDMNTVNYMINMDMIGRLSDSSRILTLGGVGTSPAWGDMLDINATRSFTIKVDSSGTGPSDHTSFYRKDIPVLFFFTGLHTDYHKPSDDAGKINYNGEVAIIDYITSIIDKSNVKAKMAFSKTKEQSMGTGRFKVSIGIMPDYTFSGQGVRADGIVEGRAAQKAGLKTGDVIVQLGEHLVTGLDTYMQALNHFNKGESTRVIVKRGSDIIEFPVTF